MNIREQFEAECCVQFADRGFYCRPIWDDGEAWCRLHLRCGALALTLPVSETAIALAGAGIRILVAVLVKEAGAVAGSFNPYELRERPELRSSEHQRPE